MIKIIIISAIIILALCMLFGKAIGHEFDND